MSKRSMRPGRLTTTRRRPFRSVAYTVCGSFESKERNQTKQFPVELLWEEADVRRFAVYHLFWGTPERKPILEQERMKARSFELK
jgi:hypothetical protein